MATLFISDLHLSVDQPALTQLFSNFIQQQAKRADALYILGDLFESWIGDDDDSLFNQKIASLLAELRMHGVKTYFLPGNRDFLIGAHFIKKTGCQLLADPTVVTLYGIPTLLTHGDSLCTLDRYYTIFRCVTHTELVKAGFLRLPLSLRQKIARYLREKGEKKPTEAYICHPKYDIVMSELFKKLKQFPAQWVIHGHTHRPCIQLLNQQTKHSAFENKTFKNQNHPHIKRFVLSDWSTGKGNTLIVFPNRNCQLVYFS